MLKGVKKCRKTIYDTFKKSMAKLFVILFLKVYIYNGHIYKVVLAFFRAFY
jgi:hypothetical protein